MVISPLTILAAMEESFKPPGVLQLPIWEEQESDRKESQESSDFSDICTM
jgi:hypothetical protein